MNIMKPGDFSNLADDYASFRPGYARDVCRAALALPNAPAGKLDVADVGAGTGIWTRTLHAMGCHKLTAVEPNEAMRAQGVRQSEGLSINWKSGSGEDTTLPTASQDVLTMASSFHWPDEAAAMSEFHRVLRPGGQFLCLEFSRVTPALAPLYDAYSFRLLPVMGRVIARDADSYRYLAESIRTFPAQDAFAEMIKAAGFDRVSYRNLSGGIVALHAGWRT